MRVIHKWKIGLRNINRLPISKSAIIRHVGEQDREIHMWVEDVLNEAPFAATGNVPIEQEKFHRAFIVYSTGREIDAGDTYVGTVMIDPHVWHVFEANLK